MMLGGVFPAWAEEKKESKPETAWSEHCDHMIGGPFVYGSISVPPDFLRKLSSVTNITEHDPFSPNDPKKDAANRVIYDKIAPITPRSKLPRCLPPISGYRDISSILKANGVALKDGEWAVVSTDSTMHFCTSLQNADIIEQIIGHSCRNPRTITQLATLVSIKNQKLNNPDWTFDFLIKQNPTIHARYGLQGRSGEKIWTTLSQKSGAKSDYEMEPTLGENGLLLDCRLAFTSSLLDPKITINQKTAITMSTKTPFVIDCGIRGNSKRNYFLVLSASSFSPDPHESEFPHVSLKKIEGIYAMQYTPGKQTPSDTTLTTCSYYTDVRFLEIIRQKIDFHHYDNIDDPFDTSRKKSDSVKTPTPPIRVKDLKPNKYHDINDQIFDITPHLSYLGINTFQGEWVYFNLTRNRMIIHGSPSLQQCIPHYMERIVPTPRIVKLKARIISVDRSGLESINWSLEKITRSNPTYIEDYSTVCRSGEKASSGLIPYVSEEKDPESGENMIKHGPAFKAAPTISESSKWIDLRYYIDSKPLEEFNTAIRVTTAATIKDGTPTIVELGHSSSSTRTHLLILHADIITPDGSFYRDRFKPVK